MFAYLFKILYKLYDIARFGTGKTMISIGFGVYFATGFVVGVERAEDLIVLIWLDFVMG